MTENKNALQVQIDELTTQNNALMGVINSDSPMTKKIKAFLQQPNVRDQYLALIPDGQNKENILQKEIHSLLWDVFNGKDLDRCTMQSLIGCLKDTLSRGLRIGSSFGEAWIIKVNTKVGTDWVNTAVIYTGYRAYINKAWNEYKIRLSVGTIATDELQYYSYDPVKRTLTCTMTLQDRTSMHTQENISDVFVTAQFDDGSTRTELFSAEALREKSKVKGKDGMQLGFVWRSTQRKTDHKEMLHKAAIISFCKLLPQQSLNELSVFDHRNTEIAMEDVTPQPSAAPTPVDIINRTLAGECTPAQDDKPVDAPAPDYDGEAIHYEGEVINPKPDDVVTHDDTAPPVDMPPPVKQKNNLQSHLALGASEKWHG